MTTRYVAFCSNMLHSPLPFGIQAFRQGSVGCTRDIPIIPTAFAALIFADDAAQLTHTHLALTTQESDDFLLRGFWPQHATLPPPFQDSSPLAGISWVCMGSSNNPNNVSCTHFLPPMRRTWAYHVSSQCLSGLGPSLSAGSFDVHDWRAPTSCTSYIPILGKPVSIFGLFSVTTVNGISHMLSVPLNPSS